MNLTIPIPISEILEEFGYEVMEFDKRIQNANIDPEQVIFIHPHKRFDLPVKIIGIHVII